MYWISHLYHKFLGMRLLIHAWLNLIHLSNSTPENYVSSVTGSLSQATVLYYSHLYTKYTISSFLFIFKFLCALVDILGRSWEFGRVNLSVD